MTRPYCGPGDHDPITGEPTELHAMDLIDVRWILQRAEEEGWRKGSGCPANHHACGELARDYVNECFAGQAATREDGRGGARQDAASLGLAGPRPLPMSIEGNLMGEPTPGELKQMRDGATQMALEGHAVRGMAEVYDLVSGQVPGPEPESD